MNYTNFTPVETESDIAHRSSTVIIGEAVVSTLPLLAETATAIEKIKGFWGLPSKEYPKRILQKKRPRLTSLGRNSIFVVCKIHPKKCSSYTKIKNVL